MLYMPQGGSWTYFPINPTASTEYMAPGDTTDEDANDEDDEPKLKKSTLFFKIFLFEFFLIFYIQF